MKSEFDGVIAVAFVLFILACAGVFTASIKYLVTDSSVTVNIPSVDVHKVEQRCLVWCQNKGGQP